MSSIRYVNQSAPFWDFIANMENQAAEHPFFAGARGEGRERDTSDDEAGWTGPWGWGWGLPGPHRGWQRGPPPYPGPFPHRPAPPHDGPAPPDAPDHDGPPPPPGPPGEPSDQPEPPHPPPPPHPHGPHEGRHRGRHGHHGEHRRERCGGRGGFGRGGFGRGPWGRRGGAFNMGALSDFIQSQMFGENAGGEAGAEDFRPEADVFDTETAFIVHLSLPGAKKEDIGVSWDADKSELIIAGVTYRPGDEELLKTIALDERKVGAFERKVRLGSRANPAAVDVDGISAKLEEGILVITVPKEDKDFVEVKKIDID